MYRYTIRLYIIHILHLLWYPFKLILFVFTLFPDADVYPSPLLYKSFPKSICTSVNNVACHGIPDDRALLDGDVINIDVTVSG